MIFVVRWNKYFSYRKRLYPFSGQLVVVIDIFLDFLFIIWFSMRTVSYSFGIAATANINRKVLCLFSGRWRWGITRRVFDIGSQTAFLNVGLYGEGCCLPKSLGANKKKKHPESMNIST